MYIYVNYFSYFVDPKREKEVKWIDQQRDIHILKNYLTRSYTRVYFQLVAFVREHLVFCKVFRWMWHKDIWMGLLRRHKLPRVSLSVECSFRFCIILYRGHCFVLDLSSSLHIYIYIYIYVCVCVCVCVCVKR